MYERIRFSYVIFAVHLQCTEMRFVSFLSGGFINAIVVNPPERKLCVQCPALYVHSMYLKITLILCKNHKNFVNASLKNVNFSVHFFSFCKMGHSANCSVCLSASIINNSSTLHVQCFKYMYCIRYSLVARQWLKKWL